MKVRFMKFETDQFRGFRRGISFACLAFATVLAINIIFSQKIFAQTKPDTFVPTVLKAPYTLVFGVRVEKPGYQLRGDTPLKPQQKGTLTLSSNGKDILYLAKFNKWSEIIICDTTTDTEYLYKKPSYDAIIQPGIKSGLIRMSLLPMPGSGYDFYPMFNSFEYSRTGQSHATMAMISQVTAVTNGIIQSMLYQDTLVEINRGVYPHTVAACRNVIAGRPGLAEETWHYSKYRMVDSVPIAGFIDHVLNTSSTAGVWPPNSIKKDGEVQYTLLSASTKPLPERSYNLTNYLLPGTVISDARKRP